MRVFGLTGGIGMGKSAAEQMLRRRGISTVDTDVLARQIVEPGQPALAEIEAAFGAGVFETDGHLRRDQLARIVFADSAAREKLESITHPRIRELWHGQIATWQAEGQPIAVVVIPLLFETGADTEVDATICIACSTATQWKRLLDRGWSSEQIRQRLAAQWPIARKLGKSDYVLWSEGSLGVLNEQIERVVRP